MDFFFIWSFITTHFTFIWFLKRKHVVHRHPLHPSSYLKVHYASCIYAIRKFIWFSNTPQLKQTYLFKWSFKFLNIQTDEYAEIDVEFFIRWQYLSIISNTYTRWISNTRHTSFSYGYSLIGSISVVYNNKTLGKWTKITFKFPT